MTSCEPAEADGPPDPEPLLQAIDHVGIAVPDYAAALELFCGVLGMRLVHEEVNTEQGVREAMLEVGPGGGPRLQLLAPLGEESPIARFLATRGPGLQQLAFRVDDVGRAGAQLRAAGLRTLSDRPVPGTAGSAIMFVHPKDVGGVLVELVAPAVESAVESAASPPRTTRKKPLDEHANESADEP